MAVDAIINGRKKPKELVDGLINREQKSENTVPNIEQYF
ncbi:hypothetical protein EfmU0317_2298 [Enterococcus faecium U0317]|nr:hypothetical protein EfmU0317_2298 [Enterococcus faecium U0317]